SARGDYRNSLLRGPASLRSRGPAVIPRPCPRSITCHCANPPCWRARGAPSLVVRRSSSRCLFGKHRCYIHFNCHIGPRQLANDKERRGRYRSAAESLCTAFQCVLKKPNIGSVGHYSHNIVHRRALHIEQFLDFHVSVPALLHEIALVNDFAITLAFRANSSKKDELSWICNGHDFRELALRPFVVVEILFLEVRRALSNGKRV